MVIVQIFPPEHKVNTVGLGYFLGKVCAIFGPVFAEKEHPLPIQLLIILNILGFILCQFIKVRRD